jgi:phosphatidylinositol alpha-1,6-mannosyltransferase
MHLALLTYSFPPQIGGVQTYLFEIMRRVAAVHKVTVITPVKGSAREETQLHRQPVANGRAHTFWQALRQLKPDRVLVGHAHPQLLLPALLFTKGNCAALTYGNDYLAAQNRWHRPLFNWLLGKSRPLITITRANQQRLHALGLPGAKIIHPGTDPIHFVPASQPKASDPILLTVGRLVSRKGTDLVLQALPYLRNQFPRLRYEIIGDGPDRERLQALVQSLDMEDMVQFLGRVSDSEMLAAYQRSHIFVMPAREEKENASMEGFGIVYLEASACGLPVVAGRSGGVAEAVRDGETGYLVEPDNPVALAEMLSRLLIDEDLRRRLGQNGRHWVETEMNWDRAARQMQLALDTV